MNTAPGRPMADQLYRELAPGQTFQMPRKDSDFLVTDLIRADANSDQPWDFRAAVDLKTGHGVWLEATLTVTPTDMAAGPA